MHQAEVRRFEPRTICVEPELWNTLTEVSDARFGKRYKLSRLIREILADWARENTNGGDNAKA